MTSLIKSFSNTNRLVSAFIQMAAGILLFASSTAFACPDLSGEYLIVDHQNEYLAINQDECSSVSVAYDLNLSNGQPKHGKTVHMTDGIFRLDSSPTTVGDREYYSLRASHFEDESLIVNIVMYARDGGKNAESLNTEYFFEDDDKNTLTIVNRKYDKTGKLTSTLKRHGVRQ